MHIEKQFILTHSQASLRHFGVAAVCLAAALACSPALAQGNSGGAAGQEFATGRILVMPRAGMTDASLDKIVKEHGGGKGRRVGKSELRIVDVPPGLERQMVEKLSQHPPCSRTPPTT